ncbi:MAG: hypothetical protein H6815_09715 [Phycisphaeraceae bacterium]|nr:hypothetical protein [Phycisphaerales bacterium]MCB9860713.1 hypothetical protein [Phycisphaeraceae bacterium]
MRRLTTFFATASIALGALPVLAEDTGAGSTSVESQLSAQQALDNTAMYLVQVWGPDQTNGFYVDLLRVTPNQPGSFDDLRVSVIATYETTQEHLQSTFDTALDDARTSTVELSLSDWLDPSQPVNHVSEVMINGVLGNGVLTARRTNLPFVMQLYSIAVPAPGPVAMLAVGSLVCLRRNRNRSCC